MRHSLPSAAACCISVFHRICFFSLADGVGISTDTTNEWVKGGVQVVFIVSTLIVAVWTAILYLLLLHRPQIFGMGIEGVLQDSFPSQIPAQGREVFRGDDDGFGGGKAGGRKILAAADGLYFPGVVVEIRHRGSHSRSFHCQGNMLVAWCRQWVMWMIFHPESYARRKRRGGVDVPPLLYRFPARCLGSHPRRHALARHLLLPFPGDGHPGLAEMDC